MALVARVVATSNRTESGYLGSGTVITLYRIHVRQFADDNTRSWCVVRRFSEFVTLHATLSRAMGNAALPPLPPKLLVNSTEALADRYLALDTFLRTLLSLPTAASHSRLRAFLGADATTAPMGSGGVHSEPWSDESDDAEGEVAGGSGEPRWLLTGSWLADESRSRDTLEPMLSAMGTPWPVRRMLRGLAITSTLRHTSGVSLVETSSSSLGQGQPATFLLDNTTRPLQLGRQVGSVRARELRNGSVRLYVGLPNERGTITDSRRLVGGGNEMERIVILRLGRSPPLRLHRLLVRQGGAVSPREVGATSRDVAAAGAAVHPDSEAAVRAVSGAAAGEASADGGGPLHVVRAALSLVWDLGCVCSAALGRPSLASVLWTALGALVVLSHAWLALDPFGESLSVALLAPDAAADAASAETADGAPSAEEALGESEAAPAAPELLDVPWRALWKVPAGTFVAAADTLVVIALVARCCARASPPARAA